PSNCAFSSGVDAAWTRCASTWAAWAGPTGNGLPKRFIWAFGESSAASYASWTWSASEYGSGSPSVAEEGVAGCAIWGARLSAAIAWGISAGFCLARALACWAVERAVRASARDWGDSGEGDICNLMGRNEESGGYSDSPAVEVLRFGANWQSRGTFFLRISSVENPRCQVDLTGGPRSARQLPLLQSPGCSPWRGSSVGPLMRAALISCGVVVLAVSSGCGGESPDTLNGWMQDAVSPLSSTDLEIHYINVGWGGAVFVKGPGTNGVKILLEAGNTGMGTA